MWGAPVCAEFKTTGAGRFITDKLVRSLEFARVAPKGSAQVGSAARLAWLAEA
jgi:hypothetical protein